MLFEAKDRILFIGDSIGDYGRERPVSDRSDAWGTSYVSIVGQLLQATYPERLYRIINMSVSGNQSRDLAARWDTDVFALKPDWVSVLIGINDVWRQFDSPDRPEAGFALADYEATVEKLISETLPRVKGMILMTPYFMEQNRADAMRATMDRYGEVVKRLGAKYGVLTIDLQKEWDDFFARGIHPHAIAWDLIHPGNTGRMVIARAFLKAVGYEW